MANLYLYIQNRSRMDFKEPPTNGRIFEVHLKEACDVINPVFILAGTPAFFITYTYAYFPDWNRYYFISDMTGNGNLTYVYCEEDVLTSFYEEIKNASFYCLRSTSDYNAELSDTLFPASLKAQNERLSVDTPWKGALEGRYVLAISSGSDYTHIGTNSYYLLTQPEITEFLSDLMGKADISFEGALDSLTKAIVNPMSYIRSCLWLPIVIDAHATIADSIDFGFWSSNATARVLDVEENADLYTEINLDFTEAKSTLFSRDVYTYTKYPPYSTLQLFAPPFGTLSVPREVVTNILNDEIFRCTLYIDHITGMGTLKFYTVIGPETTSPVIHGPFFDMTEKVGVEIPVGEVVQDFMGAVLHIGETVSSALSGHVIGAVTGIYNAIDSVVGNPQVTGTSGGFAQLELDSPWTLSRTWYDTNTDVDHCGLPCCANKNISDLSGYAQFANVDFTSKTALLTEKEQINSLLEAGVFIG